MRCVGEGRLSSRKTLVGLKGAWLDFVRQRFEMALLGIVASSLNESTVAVITEFVFSRRL